MANVQSNKQLSLTALPFSNPNILPIRLAWEEIFLSLPPDFDRDWQKLFSCSIKPSIAATAYELARLALLTLEAQGRFPDWQKGKPLPQSLSSALGAEWHTFRQVSRQPA